MSFSYTAVGGIALLSVALVALGAFSLYARSRFKFWLAEADKVSSQSGYVTPYVPRSSRLVLFLVTRIASWFFLGDLKIVGAEKIYESKTRLIICPNHQVEHDALVMSYIIGARRWRFLAAIDQLTGRRAFWMAWLGVIPVDTHNVRRQVAVIAPVAEVLQRENKSSFVMFPQGKLVDSNLLLPEDWKDGASVIGQRVRQATGEKFALLPVYIAYDRLPEQARLWQRALAKFGVSRAFCGKSVYGCKVVVGDPIEVDTNIGKKELTSQLFAAELALQANFNNSL
jgi:hypothetical protein